MYGTSFYTGEQPIKTSTKLVTKLCSALNPIFLFTGRQVVLMNLKLLFYFLGRHIAVVFYNKKIIFSVAT